MPCSCRAIVGTLSWPRMSGVSPTGHCAVECHLRGLVMTCRVRVLMVGCCAETCNTDGILCLCVVRCVFVGIECLLLCGVSGDRYVGLRFVLWLFCGSMVGLLVVLFVPLVSFLATRGLWCFLREHNRLSSRQWTQKGTAVRSSQYQRALAVLRTSSLPRRHSSGSCTTLKQLTENHDPTRTGLQR